MTRWLLWGLVLAGCGGEEAADDALDAGIDAGIDGEDAAVELVRGPVMNGTCVPHGQRFMDVYACEGVPGPAATEPPGASARVDDPDPARLDDPDTAWVLAELQACSCACCHTGAARGTYRWSMTFEPFWLDSAADDTLRVMLQAAPLGSYPDPDENHGFTRRLGMPSTDPERLNAFIERERARRGR